MPDAIQIEPRDLASVQRILAEQVPEYEVWAFGSRARGNAQKFSDLDLAVVTRTPLPLDRYLDLRAAFSDSRLPIRVDVVDLAAADAAFRGLIEGEHVVLAPAGRTTAT